MPVVSTREWLDPVPLAHILTTAVSEIQLLNSLWLCPAESAMDCPRLEPNATTACGTSHPTFADEMSSTVGDEYEMIDVDDAAIIPVVTTTRWLDLCPCALIHLTLVVDDHMAASQTENPSLIDGL